MGVISKERQTMLALYNQSINANSTYYSDAIYIGNTNSAFPLVTNPFQAIFIKGSGSTLSVTLESAFIPTLPDQSVQPDTSEYVEIQTYTQDGVINGLSLNGLWVRFKIDNTAGSPAIVTVALNY